MTEKLDERDAVTFEELVVATVIQVDAITQLLVEKGIFKQEEFFTKLEQIQNEYQEEEAD